MRAIAVVTVGRSDYGLYRPILDEIEAHPDLELRLVVGGMHLSPEHGATVQEIEADGYAIGARVAAPLASDEPSAIAAAIADGVRGFSEVFARIQPDLVLVLGDRYEMLAAVLGALPFALPIAHIHGGESTEGAFDEGIRHAITKLSHVHFAAIEPYARRILQLGEEPWRVHVTGAPGLDAIRRLEPLARDELERLTGVRLDGALLVTYHPVTLEYAQVEHRIGAMLDALGRSGYDVLFTAPNADTSNRVVARAIGEYVAAHPGSALVANLGSKAYLSALSHVRALVGNSSSGIIEAASFRLPAVDVGLRQQGRLRPANVVHADDDADAIVAAIEQATSEEFRAGLDGLVNPYGDGHAAERIVAELAAVPLGEELLLKRFYDLP